MKHCGPKWIDDCRRVVRCPMRRQEPLRSHTTFGVGGPAELFVWVNAESSLLAAVDVLDSKSVTWRVLGGGSNLLVSDGGVAGAVLHLVEELAGLRLLERSRHAMVLEAGAGARISDLLKWAERQGGDGLDGLVGIPGTVGGALKMNAGSAKGSVSDHLLEVRLLERGRCAWVPARALGFSYRHSRIGRRRIVVAARFRLPSAQPEAVRKKHAAAWAHRLGSQPKGVRSAGCFFRNPDSQSAGKLIDLAGCKGWQKGGAFVSDKHANFLVHRGDASAQDILSLARRVAGAVYGQFGIRLVREVEWWGGRRKGRR